MVNALIFCVICYIAVSGKNNTIYHQGVRHHASLFLDLVNFIFPRLRFGWRLQLNIFGVADS